MTTESKKPGARVYVCMSDTVDMPEWLPVIARIKALKTEAEKAGGQG